MRGGGNWEVWLYKENGKVLAAMPYYMENRHGRKYITKAVLTQNNGIIFNHCDGIKLNKRYKCEEKIVNAADEFIENLRLDVYEQQYHYSFTNWLPFYWHGYSAMIRYTYVIENTGNSEAVWENISSKYRNSIRRGQRNSTIIENPDAELFYKEHAKIFQKQNLPVPFSQEMWQELYAVCVMRGQGKSFAARTIEGNIASVMFLVWDDESVYLLLGGNIPVYQSLETYSSLIWNGINFAGKMGLKFDFEGSVIKRISRSFREFGGYPKAYFRIRKIYNQEVLREEFERTVNKKE